MIRPHRRSIPVCLLPSHTFLFVTHGVRAISNNLVSHTEKLTNVARRGGAGMAVGMMTALERFSECYAIRFAIEITFPSVCHLRSFKFTP